MVGEGGWCDFKQDRGYTHHQEGMDSGHSDTHREEVFAGWVSTRLLCNY